MVGARSATAAVGIIASFFISVILWWFFETALVFLFVPFVPFLFRRYTNEAPEDSIRNCPTCGYQTTNDAYSYCPKDGTRLH